MKKGRYIKVPREDRRVTSVPPSSVVSQLKFLTLGDSIGFLADQVEIGAPSEKSQDLSDSFALSDARLIVLGLHTVYSDSLNQDDSIALNEGYRVSLGDSLVQDDSIALELGYIVSLGDSLPVMADAVNTAMLGHYLSALSDNANNYLDQLALGYGLAPADQFSLTDAISTFGQIFLTIQDSIYNWDEFFIAIPQGVDFAIQRSDSFALDDSISLFSAGFKTFSDSINNLADAYSARGNGLLSFSDSLTQSDALSMIGNGLKTLSDSSIQPSDGTARSGSIWDIGVTGEQLTQSDSISIALFPTLLTYATADSFTLTDAVQVKRGPSRWNDAIVVSTASQNNLTLSLSDALPAMVDAQVNKFIRWRDSISVVKVNATGLSQVLSDTNTSMSDAVASSRTQIGQPVSDISVGLWSATPLWQKVDEFTADDSDQIVSATNPSNDTCEVGLRTSITDPVSSSGHIVSYRYRKSASGGRQIDLTVRLMQGTTIIATFTHTNISNTITQADQTLSGAQADSITNYGDLRIRFVGNAVGSGTGRAAQITWAQFRCPK